MSTNFTTPESDAAMERSDSPLFAATPVWDRRSKKRSSGSRVDAHPEPQPQGSFVAPEPRSFASDEFAAVPPLRTAPGMATPIPGASPGLLAEPAAASPGASTMTMTSSTLAAEEPSFAAQPLERRKTAKTTSPLSPAMIGGALGAVALVAGAGWLLTRAAPGVPELTPGQTTAAAGASPVVVAAAEPEVLTPANVLPQRTAAATTQPAATAPTAARRTPASVRARPAAAPVSPSAAATLPDAPQPYSSSAPTSPATAEPTPAPVEAAPVPAEAAPATPPVATTPVPTTDTPPTT